MSFATNHGLSRAAFARQIGVSAPTLAKWEKTKGKLTLHLSSFQRLEKAYNSATSSSGKNP